MKRQTFVLIVFLILLAEGAVFSFVYFNHQVETEELVDVSVLRTARPLKAPPILAQTEESFLTVPEPKIERLILSVPLYYQQHSLSCEVAALRMALAGLGVNLSESDLIEKMPINPAPRSIDNTWSDPDKEFVGSIDGAQNTTGYGVYWPVLTKLVQEWRPDSVGYRGATYADVIRELKAGHPVIYWGSVEGNPRPDNWRTSEGKEVKAWSGEHARTIVGYQGLSSSTPSQLIVNDPTYGRIVVSKSAFMRDWAHFDNSLVVVI